jgi:hypothetical protein
MQPRAGCHGDVRRMHRNCGCLHLRDLPRSRVGVDHHRRAARSRRQRYLHRRRLRLPIERSPQRRHFRRSSRRLQVSHRRSFSFVFVWTKARQFLWETNKTVIEVGLEVGYSSLYPSRRRAAMEWH